MRHVNLSIRLALFLAVVGCAGFSTPALSEPKAYDLVKYYGEAGNLQIAFDFADGYSDASEIRVTNRATKKSARFKVADAGEARFVSSNGNEEIVLKSDLKNAPPQVIAGTYRASGKKIPFILKRK